MKKFYRDFYGGTACISIKKDGSAKLTVSAGGRRYHNKTYKTERGARVAMGKLGDCWVQQ